MTWKLSEIANAVNGKLVNASEDVAVTGIQFDSRKLKAGHLFVPLIAQRNGHDFIQSAIDNDAVGAFWSEDDKAIPMNFPVIKVDDTHRALIEFAKWHLNKINPLKVAITGSNGKTTTKDMVAAVLSEQYKTHKTQGNFNNDIGVPMTLLGMSTDTEAIVVEMGMDKVGEISELSQMVHPDIAIITMIGESHIEFFGSREKIAKAKVEILDGLNDEGLFIVNGDEPLLEGAITKLKNSNGPKTVKTFGTKDTNDLYSKNIETEKRQTSFNINLDLNKQLTIPTPGSYNVNNALSAILVGLHVKMPLDLIAKGLQGFQLTKNRLEWIDGVNGSSILNDAYNASPSSMKAVLDYFSTLEVKGKKIAVLGDIRELGELSEELHASIHKSIDPESIDVVYLYGVEMEALYQKLEKQFTDQTLIYIKEDQDELISKLKKQIQAEDAVLLKSSFGTNLLNVIEQIKEH